MVRNVIFFGGTGEGKSSCINLLAGRNIADTSSNAAGCTFNNTVHSLTLNGQAYQLWDTAGLNESEGGRVPHQQAIVQLYRLLKQLRGGISLLVFIMRAPRLKDSAQPNWVLFHEIICQGKVPIIAVTTGLELEEGNMDDWWTRNQHHFYNKGMRPSGHACVTAVRGLKRNNGNYVFDPEYNESKRNLANAITRACLPRPHVFQGGTWFKEIVEVTYKKRGCFGGQKRYENRKEVTGKGVEQLRQRCGMSHTEAEALGRIFAAIDAGR